MSVKVNIWERVIDRHRTEDDPNKYQADIIGKGFDHHGIAPTPSEALVLAATHWHANRRSS